MDAFWQTLSLAELSTEQWEALCDGCGKCCLHKLEDEADGEVYYAGVACTLLDLTRCRCKNYSQRFEKVADCLRLTPDNTESFTWLPATCAYRLVAEGKPLAAWHPLVSGDPQSVHEAGVSVLGKVVSADDVHEDDYQEHVVYWVDDTP